jgi:hypothetical protein
MGYPKKHSHEIKSEMEDSFSFSRNEISFLTETMQCKNHVGCHLPCFGFLFCCFIKGEGELWKAKYHDFEIKSKTKNKKMLTVNRNQQRNFSCIIELMCFIDCNYENRQDNLQKSLL